MQILRTLMHSFIKYIYATTTLAAHVYMNKKIISIFELAKKIEIIFVFLFRLNPTNAAGQPSIEKEKSESDDDFNNNKHMK